MAEVERAFRTTGRGHRDYSEAMERSANQSLGDLLQGDRPPLRHAAADHSSIDGSQWTEGNASLRAVRGRTYYGSQDVEGASGRIPERSMRRRQGSGPKADLY